MRLRLLKQLDYSSVLALIRMEPKSAGSKPAKHRGRPRKDAEEMEFSTLAVTLIGERVRKLQEMAPYITVSVLVHHAIDRAYDLIHGRPLKSPDQPKRQLENLRALIKPAASESASDTDLRRVLVVKVYGERRDRLEEIRPLQITTAIVQRLIDAAHAIFITHLQIDKLSTEVVPYLALEGFRAKKTVTLEIDG